MNGGAGGERSQVESFTPDTCNANRGKADTPPSSSAKRPQSASSGVSTCWRGRPEKEHEGELDQVELKEVCPRRGNLCFEITPKSYHGDWGLHVEQWGQTSELAWKVERVFLECASKHNRKRAFAHVMTLRARRSWVERIIVSNPTDGMSRWCKNE